MKGGKDGRMGELDWMGVGVTGGGIVIGLMALDKRKHRKALKPDVCRQCH